MLLQRLSDWQPVDALRDQSEFGTRTVFNQETIVVCVTSLNCSYSLSQVSIVRYRNKPT